MKLSEKKSGNFEPHEEGTFKGVCVDVTPLTKQVSQFGEREVFKLVFETDAPARNDGSPQCVWSRGFTPSLNEKANFRKFLRQWMGRDLTPAELVEFDTESLIGIPCQLVITHDQGSDGNIYSNIVACTPCKKDPIAASGKFTRKKDKEAQGEEAQHRTAAKPTGGTQDAEAVDSTQAGSDWTKVKVHVGKHQGIELRDLDEAAITKLLSNWVPTVANNPKATAADKRLVAALEKAQEALNGGGEEATQEDF
jgi:hypothetical protein